MNRLYLLLIVIMALFSWVGSVYGLMLPDGEIIPNLLTPESLRWFVRHSIDHIAASPLVELLMVLIVIGALRSSGLLAAIVSHASLSRRERHALVISVVLLGGELILLLWGILPGGNLLSITGHIHGGPLERGWLFILLVTVCAPCIIYGRMSGAWLSNGEVASHLTSEISRQASYVVTCIIASQFMAGVHYIRLFDLLAWGNAMRMLFSALIYGIPLIMLFLTKNSIHGSSSAK